MLPGPGSLLAIAAEITLAESMPWAIRVSKMVVAAYSTLMCRALLSPDTAANRTISASVIVLAKVADMPIRRSANSYPPSLFIGLFFPRACSKQTRGSPFAPAYPAWGNLRASRRRYDRSGSGSGRRPSLLAA